MLFLQVECKTAEFVKACQGKSGLIRYIQNVFWMTLNFSSKTVAMLVGLLVIFEQAFQSVSGRLS